MKMPPATNTDTNTTAAPSPHDDARATPYALTVMAVHDDKGAIRRLTLSRPEDKNFSYKAGQYIWLSFGTFAPRAYSIACAPRPDTLEIHIKDTGAGGASTYALTHIHESHIVKASPPAGDSFYDPAQHSARPLLCLAGGLGITPLKAIVEDALRDPARTAPVTLYWGVRHEDDFYLDDAFADLARRYPLFAYRRVVAQPVGAQALAALHDLSSHAIFMGGPPAMIAATLPALQDRHAAPNMIYYDDYEAIL